ncbi:MAG TPA: hypothetical protein VMF08_05205 [Candidatus Sulfotelmatobacter sp.]|nr:hypothetical protein [Candidatus Sulfotelmatobacter sp.]
MAKVPDQIPAELLDPRFESLPAPPAPNPEFNDRLDGVVIPVWEGDVYLAKACCASIRQSMGDIPITLLVDGKATDTRDLQRLHGVERLCIQETIEPEIVRLCSGTPWTKMMLFWMSPYERFLCLDADLLVWGDLRACADFNKYDFIMTHRFQTTVTFTKAQDLLGCISDPAIFTKLDPALDWHGQEEDNTGVFFARRGIFSKDALMTLRRMDCWTCYESGVFRYLYWKALRDGTPRAAGRKLQLFPADRDSRPEDRYPPRNSQSPKVIHWITKKPKLGRRFQASDDYRKLFLKLTGRTHLLGVRLLLEDLGVWLKRQSRSLAKPRRN